MTEALALQGGERVLEIGTGSGYAAAILAEIESIRRVTTVGPAPVEGKRSQLASTSDRRMAGGRPHHWARGAVFRMGALGWPGMGCRYDFGPARARGGDRHQLATRRCRLGYRGRAVDAGGAGLCRIPRRRRGRFDVRRRAIPRGLCRASRKPGNDGAPRPGTAHGGPPPQRPARRGRLDVIEPGDRLVVRKGDVVPVDGVVIEGLAVLDQSALTGESVPVQQKVGDGVMSGATNVGEAFHLLTTRRAAESTYAGIVRLVEAAQRSRAPMARLADRYAMVFLAATIALAGASWV